MAASTGKTHCVRCAKEKCSYRCTGCSKDFCMNHLKDHQQELEKQFDEVEVNRKTFQESLAEQMKKVQDNPLIKQIDTWEHESINKIRDTAEAAKLLLTQHINGYYNEIEIKLSKLTKELKEIREDNDFNEINLRRFQENLTRLSTEQIKVPILTIPQDSSSSINNIHGKVSGLIWLSSIKAQSEVNMKNIQKMAAIESGLDTSYQQTDDIFRNRIQQISDKVAADINKIIAETQNQQSTLLADANARMNSIEEEYRTKLQRLVGELDTVKAQNLTTLEKDLHLRHTMIFDQARKRIDGLYEETNLLKMTVLQEARLNMNATTEDVSERTTTMNVENSNRHERQQ